MADETRTTTPTAPELVEAEATPELTETEIFAANLAMLSKVLEREPLYRAMLLRILGDCREEQQLENLEEHITHYDEYASCSQGPYFLISKLTDAGGLELRERDDRGELVGPERKEGLTEDEVDDLVCTTGYLTTAVGEAYIEANTSEERIGSLMSREESRATAYIDLLEYVNEQNRSYNEIKEFLTGSPALETVIDGSAVTMQPSVFVDRLEAAGALVWNDGWQLSKEGLGYLTANRPQNR
jgi:hypothetical protein